jgi:hypothetical protein
VSESGSVPELFFINRSGQDILLVDGEELVGAKQNRVLNLTILVAAGQELKIPVSCVEAGPWNWHSKRFASGRKLNAKARQGKMRGVSASLRESGARASGDIQSEVWDGVGEKMARFRVASSTSSLNDVYEATETRLAPLRECFAAVPGQVGAVFAINGRLAGTELFDASSTLAKLLPKLVDSYAFDAIESEPEAGRLAPPSLDEVKRLLARIAGANTRVYKGVAKGEDVRIEEPDLQAALLMESGRVVHLSAFETEMP